MAHDHLGPPDKSAVATESFGDGSGGTKVLTAAWVTGTPVDVKRRSNAVIQVKYVKGDETTARLRIMQGKGAQSADVTKWFQAGELGTSTNGLRPLQLGEVKLTPADFAATDYVSFSVNCPGADWLRVDAMAVGGTPTGAILAEVAGGWGM